MFNQVTLLGRLGKDAETKFTQSGVAKTTFSVATDERWKNKDTGQYETVTDWHNCVMWRNENLANLLVKGKLVLVVGRLKTRSYDDKDGVKKWVTEINVDEIKLASPKTNDGGGQSAPAAGNSAGITDDDVPF